MLTDTLETKFNASPMREAVVLALRNHDLRKIDELVRRGASESREVRCSLIS